MIVLFRNYRQLNTDGVVEQKGPFKGHQNNQEYLKNVDVLNMDGSQDESHIINAVLHWNMFVLFFSHLLSTQFKPDFSIIRPTESRLILTFNIRMNIRSCSKFQNVTNQTFNMFPCIKSSDID